MTSAQVKHPHFQPVVELLRETRRRRAESDRTPTPADTYLVRDDGETFEELVALRIRGLSSLLIGATRFQRQKAPGGLAYARRPLAMYLSTPPKQLGLTGEARPAHLLELVLPEADEEISTFRERLRRGDQGWTLYLDVETVELAFDFRFENPSVEREQGVYQGKAETHVLRTIEGHVLSGITHGLHRRLHQGASFFTVQAPLQYTPEGVHLLPPALVIHRSFIAMDAQLQEGEAPSAWTSRVAPFLSTSALSRHVLTPETG